MKKNPIGWNMNSNVICFKCQGLGCERPYGMANGRFLINFPMKWKRKCISSCDMKRHWLIEMGKWKDGRYDGQWEIPHAFPHEMKKQMHFFMWHEKALVGWKNQIYKF
jgi:hypothetical protein